MLKVFYPYRGFIKLARKGYIINSISWIILVPCQENDVYDVISLKTDVSGIVKHMSLLLPNCQFTKNPIKIQSENSIKMLLTHQNSR